MGELFEQSVSREKKMETVHEEIHVAACTPPRGIWRLDAVTCEDGLHFESFQSFPPPKKNIIEK